MRIAVAASLLMLASTANAAVLCATTRRDGTFNSSVKVREACRPKEVQLAIVGQPPVIIEPQASSTTSTSAAPTTTSPTPTTTPTTTLATTTTIGGGVCGNNVIEGGEVCDCGIPPCEPVRYGPFSGVNQGGCPNGAGGSATYCASDCSACLPAPRCGNGSLEAGDTCDWLGGSSADNCAPGSLCQDTVPCECSCAGVGQSCLQQTACCGALTCVSGVCQ